MGLSGYVFATDVSRLSSAFHSADRAFLVPPCSSPEFVPTVLEICRQNHVSLAIPTIDPELPVYASSRESFSKVGTTLAVSTPEVIAIGSDKIETHAWLVRGNFPTVGQATVPEVTAHPELWPFPLVVKPRWGSASIGVAVVSDLLELETATRGAEFVVQTVATGDEYTIDALVDSQGRCVGTVPRRRIEVRAGEVSKGVTTRSVALEKLALCVCEALPGAYGPLTMQVFMDASTGATSVIELNPRFGGGFPLSWRAGADFPRRMIEEILKIPPRSRTVEWQDGLVMLRYDESVFVDARTAGLGS
jgi:carbamoyl-phosphate synthase large subunit